MLLVLKINFRKYTVNDSWQSLLYNDDASTEQQIVVFTKVGWLVSEEDMVQLAADETKVL